MKKQKLPPVPPERGLRIPTTPNKLAADATVGHKPKRRKPYKK